MRYGAVTKDGKGEVVTGIAMMLKGENSRTVVERVKQKVEEIRQNLPKGVDIIPFYDRADLVNDVIHTVIRNIIFGIILIIIVLTLYGRKLARYHSLIAFSVPLTVVLTFSGMYHHGDCCYGNEPWFLGFGVTLPMDPCVTVENIIRRLTLRKRQR